MQELRTAPRQRRSRESIESILDAAERLIHGQGQVSFTANELAVAAGMSIGRVYYWFPDMHSVVSALADRAAERLAELFLAVAKVDGEKPAAEVLAESVGVLCRHLDDSPATVALCLSGGGQADYGASLRERLVAAARHVLLERVPGVPEPEVELVSRTGIGILLGMLHAYTKADDGERPFIEQELVYVLVSWLHARYPGVDDPVWSDPHPVTLPARPSNRPRTRTSVAPALHDPGARPAP